MLQHLLTAKPKNYNACTDDALLKNIAKGDKKAFSQLVERHWQRLYYVALRIAGTQASAEDVVQAVFTKLWQQPYHYTADNKAHAWLNKMTKNTAIDHKRSQKRDRLIEGAPEDRLAGVASTQNIEQELLAQSSTQRLHQAIDALAKPWALVIRLYFFEQLSQKQIAKRLCLSISSVEKKLAKAKSALRQQLQYSH